MLFLLICWVITWYLMQNLGPEAKSVENEFKKSLKIK